VGLILTRPIREGLGKGEGAVLHRSVKKDDAENRRWRIELSGRNDSRPHLTTASAPPKVERYGAANITNLLHWER